jgi:2-dehydropantoate 2-reductase
MRPVNSKPRIAILGTGAVGGYFGGLLAGKYSNSKETEIIFITRPATEKVIQEKGLKIIREKDERIVFPDLVSSDPATIGKIDLLICCIKSYDLEESLAPLAPCFSKDTVILPLLNGVDAAPRIKKMFPDADVWKGCVYIVSRLIERGVVKELGSGHSFFFGSSKESEEKLEKYHKIFKNAGINAFLSEDIEHDIWEKFIFISSLASLTSYLDKPLGAILEDPNHLQTLKELMQELLQIASAKGISFPGNIIETRIAKMKTLAYETTSSMHSDFQKGGKTEYESLTKYVVDLGKELNIQTPVYNKILNGLLLKVE